MMAKAARGQKEIVLTHLNQLINLLLSRPSSINELTLRRSILAESMEGRRTLTRSRVLGNNVFGEFSDEGRLGGAGGSERERVGDGVVEELGAPREVSVRRAEHRDEREAPTGKYVSTQILGLSSSFLSLCPRSSFRPRALLIALLVFLQAPFFPLPCLPRFSFRPPSNASFDSTDPAS